MAQAAELADLEKAYAAARPREAIAPEEVLGLLGKAITKASAADTDAAEARAVSLRALALAESITGDVEKSGDGGDEGSVSVDAAVLADVRKDAEGHEGGGRPMGVMLDVLKSRIGDAPAADPPAPVDKSGDGDGEADDLFSYDLNADPEFAVDKAALAAADAADDD